MPPAGSHSMTRLLEATAASTGEDYFRALARGTADALGARWGFVGVLLPGGRRARLLAIWAGHAFDEPFNYELEGTPCEQVVKGSIVHYPDDVQRLFPTDEILPRLGATSYFGLPLRDAAGKIRGVLGALNDGPLAVPDEVPSLLGFFAVRTCAELDRLADEQSLRESERRYRELVTTCAEGVWVIDENARTVFANDQMARMVGVPLAAMIGRPVFDFLPEATHEPTRVNIERRKAGVSERHDACLRRSDGSTFDVSMATSPITAPDGSYAGALALVTDLTELRALEGTIRDAQRHESLSLLAGGVAHDFNNLLAGVLGRADLALAALPPESPARVHVTGIRDAAERAADLTRQLLAYAGKASYSPETIDVNRAVSDVATLGVAAISKKISLSLNLSPDTPALRGDRGALTQVLLNLITNAAQAIGDRPGLISVTTDLVDVPPDTFPTVEGGFLPSGRCVLLRVSDDGVGMDEPTSKRVFQPFFTTKPDGHGLGLAAVQGIVRSHHGAIEVSSTPGEGSTFELRFPAAMDGPAAGPRARTIPPPGVSRKVLVADDEQGVREVIRMALESNGYVVDLCTDGAAAVEKVKATGADYAVVLLDVTMPAMDGIEASRLIRASNDSLPIVLMSGYTEEGLPDDDVHATFLQKPFRMSTLLGAIRDALS